MTRGSEIPSGKILSAWPAWTKALICSSVNWPDHSRSLLCEAFQKSEKALKNALERAARLSPSTTALR